MGVSSEGNPTAHSKGIMSSISGCSHFGALGTGLDNATVAEERVRIKVSRFIVRLQGLINVARYVKGKGNWQRFIGSEGCELWYG